MSQLCPRCSYDNPDAAAFCAACSEPLRNLLGANFLLAGRYQIVRVLGCGGMGVVYLARDLRIPGREVAVKASLAPQAHVQFQHEVSLLAQLHHPGLPGISDQFADHLGRPHLVMDYISGDTLDDLVARRGRLTEAEAIRLIDSLLDVVIYLHARGVIHRDIKPSNLKLTPDGRLFLVDFGISKIIVPGQPTQTWARGYGSPGFAPVEQYGTGTDARSDIYSIGAVFYYLLAGQAPPPAPDLMAGATLPALAVLRPDVTAGTRQVVTTALASFPAQRYQSAAQMRSSLHAPQPPTQRVQAPAVATTARALSPSRPWGAFLALGAVATVSLIAAVALLVRPAPAPSPGPMPALTWTPTGIVSASPVPPLPTSTVTRLPAPDVPTDTPTSPARATATPTDAPRPTWTATELPPTPTDTPEPEPTPTETDFPTPTFTPPAPEFAPPLAAEQLTFGAGKDYAPIFHPNGRELAYFSDIRGVWQIYILDARGNVRGPLFDDGLNYYHPHFSPDGGWLYFDSDMSGAWKIYRCPYPECSWYELLPGGASNGRLPIPSPDGREILYMCGTPDNEEICMMDSDGGNARRLISGAGYDGMHNYSPDGSRIVFQSGRSGNQEIYVYDLRDGALSQVTNHPKRDASPVWSPDGEWIAFETNRDGNNEIYVVRPDGTDLRNLTRHTNWDWLPSFSPDGRIIAFQSTRDSEKMNLWMIPFRP